MLGNSEKVGIELVNATVVNETSGPLGGRGSSLNPLGFEMQPIDHFSYKSVDGVINFGCN